MSPVTHLIGSWLIASAATRNSRDRKLATLAGVIPDADGLGIVVDFAASLTSGEPPTFEHYQQYHHALLHGWPAALAIALILASFGREHIRLAVVCLITFHVHLVCDLVGSRGPSPGDLWPVFYGEPFFRDPVWIWRSQWRLDGWKNKSVFVTLFIVSIVTAVRTGHSFVELLGQRLDAVVVAVLRKWRDQLARLFNLR